MKHRKTKIVCTMGPATQSDEILREMMLSGMDVVRLNFSHGNHETHGGNIARVKRLREELGMPIGIMLDTKGPEIRVGDFTDGRVHLTKGQTFTLCAYDVPGTVYWREALYLPGAETPIHVGAPRLPNETTIDARYGIANDPDREPRLEQRGFMVLGDFMRKRGKTADRAGACLDARVGIGQEQHVVHETRKTM